MSAATMWPMWNVMMARVRRKPMYPKTRALAPMEEMLDGAKVHSSRPARSQTVIVTWRTVRAF